jgi:hypothetical protein
LPCQITPCHTRQFPRNNAPLNLPRFHEKPRPGTALWPILIGAFLAIGLRRWTRLLPELPEGDIVVAGESAARATISWGAALERTDTLLRRWPVACLSLLMVAIVLCALMLTAR